jgi:hypothetical protein
MRSAWRGGLLAGLVLCALGLLVVGIASLRTLVGRQVPAELLGSQVAYTVGAIVLGLAMILWGLTGGRGHVARTPRSRPEQGEG